MAMKRVLESLDGLSEDMQKEYKKGDGNKFYLLVEGDEELNTLRAAKDKILDEKKKLQERLALFGDADPEAVKEAIAKKAELDEKERKIKEAELVEKGKVEELLALRTENMKKDHATQIAAMQEANKTLTDENGKLKLNLSKAVIERGIMDAISEVGVPKKGAIVDIMARASRTFQVGEDGSPIPRTADGTIIYGIDPSKPQTPLEWVGALLKDAPYLFEESKGGGAKGSQQSISGKKLTTEEYEKLPPEIKMNMARGFV